MENDNKPGPSSQEKETIDMGKPRIEAPVHVKASGNSILVSPRQRGNPLLKSITNVPWEFDDRIIPDYVMGKTVCALFLSIRYHNLNPDYIHDRLKALGKNYSLRVLVVLMDVKEPYHALKTLTRISILADLTVMPCRTSEDAGKMIERYKIYIYKPPDMIKEKTDGDERLRILSALTSIRSVNKTDATMLLSTFGTLEKIMRASESSLSLCPGFGPQKAERLHKALRLSFRLDDPGIPPLKRKRT